MYYKLIRLEKQFHRDTYDSSMKWLTISETCIEDQYFSADGLHEY